MSLDPTVGSEIRKAHPVTVVSSALFDELAVRLVVPLTTWQPRFARQFNKVHVPRSSQNGLANDSAADVLQTRAVSLHRFVNRLGTLEPALLDEIVAGLLVALDYSP